MNSILEARLHIALNPPHSTILVDGEIESLLGYSANAFLKGEISLIDCIHAHDQNLSTEIFTNTLTNSHKHFNIRLRQANGKIRCIKGEYIKAIVANSGIILKLLLQDAKSIQQCTVSQASLSNFKAMMDNTEDYIYFKDRNHVFTGASQTLVSLTEPSEHWSDLLGLTDYDVFPEEYADIYYSLEKQIFSGVNVANDIQKTLDNQGNEGWVDNRKYPIHNDKNEIIGLFGIARNITEQHNKQIENERLLAEQGAILNNQLMAIVILCDRKIVWSNPTFSKIVGYSEAELIGQATSKFYAHEKDYLAVGAAYSEIEKQGVIAQEVEFIHKNGSSLWIDIRGSLLNKQLGQSIWTLADVSKRKKHELALIQSEIKFRTFFNSTHDAVAILKDYRFIDCNQASLDLFGCPSVAEFSEKSPADISPITQPCGNTSAKLAMKWMQQATTEEQQHFEWQHKNLATGRLFFADVLLSPMLLNGDHLIQVTVRDITQQKLAAEKIQLSARVFTNSNDSIIITDAKNNIISVNPAFSRLTGYSSTDVLGKNPSILRSNKQSIDFYHAMWTAVDNNGYWQGELWNQKKSGEIYAELLSISSLKDNTGNIVNYIGIAADITQSKIQKEKFKQMAHYDALTGLPNRTLFVDRFQQAIAHSKRTDTQVAVCFLDLDNFKPVNDNFGHDVGDKLLIEVAHRILQCIRAEDTASRQGGDEFALLLIDIESYAQCKQTLERIHHSLSQPYLLGNNKHHVGVSMGVTLYPNDSEDVDILMRHADQAMYEAKQSGRDRYHLFNTTQNQQQVIKNHHLIEIERALKNNELALFYQPKVNMLSGKVFGAEALIRWIHPDKGLLPPAEFLPLIDGSNLEIKLGDWVMNQAIKQMDDWLQKGIQLEVSINISSLHLQSKHFIEQLEQTLNKYPRVNAEHLQLEILESSALGDLQTVSRVIKTCQKSLGVNIALDDFGTGYSSLTHLRSLSANTIKIDQSFIRDMLDDPNDYTIIDGIIGLADTFDRDVIAEGVESTQHGLMLLMLGCHYAQGYTISKPLPASDFVAWLNNYQENKSWATCASTSCTQIEKKIALFHLVAEQWKDRFVANLMAEPESIKNWPLLYSAECHCGYWIKREKESTLFKHKQLNSLEKAHNACHDIALALLEQYNKGELAQARDGLTNLQSAFDEMYNKLEACKAH